MSDETPLHARPLATCERPRTVLIKLLAQLEAEMPALMYDRATLPDTFHARASSILQFSGPRDESFVQQELEAIARRAGLEAGHV